MISARRISEATVTRPASPVSTGKETRTSNPHLGAKAFRTNASLYLESCEKFRQRRRREQLCYRCLGVFAVLTVLALGILQCCGGSNPPERRRLTYTYGDVIQITYPPTKRRRRTVIKTGTVQRYDKHKKGYHVEHINNDVNSRSEIFKPEDGKITLIEKAVREKRPKRKLPAASAGGSNVTVAKKIGDAENNFIRPKMYYVTADGGVEVNHDSYAYHHQRSATKGQINPHAAQRIGHTAKKARTPAVPARVTKPDKRFQLNDDPECVIYYDGSADTWLMTSNGEDEAPEWDTILAPTPSELHTSFTEIDLRRRLVTATPAHP